MSSMGFVALIVVGYLIGINIYGYYLMAEDKQRAREGRRDRISETTILVVALVLGIGGVYAGMQNVRHKTRKSEFKVRLGTVLVAQIVIGYMICANIVA